MTYVAAWIGTRLNAHFQVSQRLGVGLRFPALPYNVVVLVAAQRVAEIRSENESLRHIDVEGLRVVLVQGATKFSDPFQQLGPASFHSAFLQFILVGVKLGCDRAPDGQFVECPRMGQLARFKPFGFDPGLNLSAFGVGNGLQDLLLLQGVSDKFHRWFEAKVGCLGRCSWSQAAFFV
jgi:hypothetical protein